MEYMDRIIERRNVIRNRIPSFPFMSCTDSALDLQNQLGFVYVLGTYVGHISDEYREQLAKYISKDLKNNSRNMKYWQGLNKDFNSVAHSFNYDPVNGNFIDITARQFDSSLDEIVIIHREDPRVAFLTRPVINETTHSVRRFIEGVGSSGELEGWDIDTEFLLNEGVVVPEGYPLDL